MADDEARKRRRLGEGDTEPESIPLASLPSNADIKGLVEEKEVDDCLRLLGIPSKIALTGGGRNTRKDRRLKAKRKAIQDRVDEVAIFHQQQNPLLAPSLALAAQVQRQANENPSDLVGVSRNSFVPVPDLGAAVFNVFLKKEEGQLKDSPVSHDERMRSLYRLVIENSRESQASQVGDPSTDDLHTSVKDVDFEAVKKDFLHRFTPKSGRDVDSLARLAYVLTHEKVYPFFISGTGTGADALSKLNNHSYMKPFETGGIVFQMFNNTGAWLHWLPPSRSIPSECRAFEPHHYRAMSSSVLKKLTADVRSALGRVLSNLEQSGHNANLDQDTALLEFMNNEKSFPPALLLLFYRLFDDAGVLQQFARSLSANCLGELGSPDPSVVAPTGTGASTKKGKVSKPKQRQGRASAPPPAAAANRTSIVALYARA